MKVYCTILHPSGRFLRPLQHHTPSTASDAQVVDGALLRHYSNYYVEYSTSMARRKGETFTYRALPFLDCCPHEEKGGGGGAATASSASAVDAADAEAEVEAGAEAGGEAD